MSVVYAKKFRKENFLNYSAGAPISVKTNRAAVSNWGHNYGAEVYSANFTVNTVNKTWQCTEPYNVDGTPRDDFYPTNLSSALGTFTSNPRQFILLNVHGGGNVSTNYSSGNIYYTGDGIIRFTSITADISTTSASIRITNALSSGNFIGIGSTQWFYFLTNCRIFGNVQFRQIGSTDTPKIQSGSILNNFTGVSGTNANVFNNCLIIGSIDELRQPSGDLNFESSYLIGGIGVNSGTNLNGNLLVKSTTTLPNYIGSSVVDNGVIFNNEIAKDYTLNISTSGNSYRYPTNKNIGLNLGLPIYTTAVANGNEIAISDIAADDDGAGSFLIHNSDAWFDLAGSYLLTQFNLIGLESLNTSFDSVDGSGIFTPNAGHDAPTDIALKSGRVGIYVKLKRVDDVETPWLFIEADQPVFLTSDFAKTQWMLAIDGTDGVTTDTSGMIPLSDFGRVKEVKYGTFYPSTGAYTTFKGITAVTTYAPGTIAMVDITEQIGNLSVSQISAATLKDKNGFSADKALTFQPGATQADETDFEFSEDGAIDVEITCTIESNYNSGRTRSETLTIQD